MAVKNVNSILFKNGEDTYVIKGADIKISQEQGNIMVEKPDGLFASSTDLTGYARTEDLENINIKSLLEKANISTEITWTED